MHLLQDQRSDKSASAEHEKRKEQNATWHTSPHHTRKGERFIPTVQTRDWGVFEENVWIGRYGLSVLLLHLVHVGLRGRVHLTKAWGL